MRNSAIKALGNICDARITEPLIAALQDKWGDNSIAAAKVLGQIGDPQALEPLLSHLRINNSHFESTRNYGYVNQMKACVEGLAGLGERSVNSLLDIVLQGYPLDVRRMAAQALVTLYHSDKLTETTRSQILAQRANITSSHTDHKDKGACIHDDQGYSGTRECDNHSDHYSSHTDKGLGVEL